MSTKVKSAPRDEAREILNEIRRLCCHLESCGMSEAEVRAKVLNLFGQKCTIVPAREGYQPNGAPADAGM